MPYLLCLVCSFIRQFYRFLVRRSPIEGFFTGLAIVLAARSIMSISLAIFCTDFYTLIAFWVWLSYTKQEKIVFLPPPKPKVRRFLDTKPTSDVINKDIKALEN